MGSKPTEVFQFCPDFLALIPYHLVLSPETDLNHCSVRNAGEGVGTDIKEITAAQQCLSAQRLAAFCIRRKILLAHPSTETTFLSLVNNVFLEINTGQVLTCLGELSVPDANTPQRLLTHRRGTRTTQLPTSHPGSHRVS